MDGLQDLGRGFWLTFTPTCAKNRYKEASNERCDDPAGDDCNFLEDEAENFIRNLVHIG